MAPWPSSVIQQWAWLKQDPAGRTVRATEECLRYDAPVKSIQRIASQDVDLHGKLLRKDDRIRWFISSANRDPKAFAALRHLTSPAIRTHMWPLALGSIIALGRRWLVWKGKRRSKPWRSASPICAWKRRIWRISPVSPSVRSSLCQ